MMHGSVPWPSTGKFNLLSKSNNRGFGPYLEENHHEESNHHIISRYVVCNRCLGLHDKYLLYQWQDGRMHYLLLWE
jgi:hypothetical protein